MKLILFDCLVKISEQLRVSEPENCQPGTGNPKGNWEMRQC